MSVEAIHNKTNYIYNISRACTRLSPGYVRVSDSIHVFYLCANCLIVTKPSFYIKRNMQL